MEFSSTLIRSRLAWCRLQRMQATTKEDADKFLAEEEGLLDAMLGRNRSDMYGHDQPARRGSYEVGLHDGKALMGRGARHSCYVIVGRLSAWAVRAVGDSSFMSISWTRGRVPYQDFMGGGVSIVARLAIT